MTYIASAAEKFLHESDTVSPPPRNHEFIPSSTTTPGSTQTHLCDEQAESKPVLVHPTAVKEAPTLAMHDPMAQLAAAATRIADMMASHLHMHEEEDDEVAPAVLERMLKDSPIAPFLNDDRVTDILINGPTEIYVAREHGLEKTGAAFPNRRSLRVLAHAIAASVGRTIDAGRPLVDARLKDGSRVNIITPPMAVNGIAMSIRKFAKRNITLETLVENGEMTPSMARFLQLCAENRVTMLISGGTGTGKTTLLNAISRYIPESERIITIEDTAELRLQQAHVVSLETKEPRIIGQRQEEVNAADLVRNALRMRPDRIIVGEIRGDEAYDMVQAMNTGHDGSMATVHASTPRDAFARVENLVSPRMPTMPTASVRRQLVSALTIIVQLVYNGDGKRLVSSITEVVGMEGDMPTMQELFTLKQSPGGHAHQEWTNILPHHPKLNEAIRNDAAFVRSLETR